MEQILFPETRQQQNRLYSIIHILEELPEANNY